MEINLLYEFGLAILFPVARSVCGWGQKALEDSKVTVFEWKQLGSTVIRVGSIAVMAYFGLNELGLDVGLIGASASGFLIDLLVRAAKNKK